MEERVARVVKEADEVAALEGTARRTRQDRRGSPVQVLRQGLGIGVGLLHLEETRAGVVPADDDDVVRGCVAVSDEALRPAAAAGPVRVQES